MQALEFYKRVTMDNVNLLERLVGLLREHDIRFCVIGGQAVNAYVEPLVSLDLDLVVALDRLDSVRRLFGEPYRVEEFPHSMNVSLPGSDLRVQFQTDPRYEAFVQRASEREVLGMRLPVAQIEDVLQGKVWAATDETRRPSKRRKDLLDIERVLEAYPSLRQRVPEKLLAKLL